MKKDQWYNLLGKNLKEVNSVRDMIKEEEIFSANEETTQKASIDDLLSNVRRGDTSELKSLIKQYLGNVNIYYGATVGNRKDDGYFVVGGDEKMIKLIGYALNADEVTTVSFYGKSSRRFDAGVKRKAVRIWFD